MSEKLARFELSVIFLANIKQLSLKLDAEKHTDQYCGRNRWRVGM